MAMAAGAASRTTAQAADKPKHLLVVTTTYGFPHSSIPTAERVLADLGKRSGVFTVEIVGSGPRPKDKAEELKWDDKARGALADKMSLAALERFDGVIFANTTGDLPLPDREGFVRWIKSGKPLIGMHSASDTFHGYPEFIDVLGGEFLSHGPQVTVACVNEDPAHPAVRHLGPTYTVFDEIYLFKSFHRERVHGLLSLHTQPNTGQPGDYPVAWCKTVGSGRVFYTSLGHREDVWENAVYQRHILGGIRWALGLEPGDSTPQDRSARLSASEAAEGFRPLFNGKDLKGWKLRNPSGRASWSAQNGMLVNRATDKDHGTDLVSEETFRDFVLRYDYMVPSGANSGVYLRGRHEIQILDDFLATKPQMGGNAALYSVKPASEIATRAPGEWQTVEATIRGQRVSVWLNGVWVHQDVEVPKATGGELDNKLQEPGPIMLQGDHGAVAFRNLRIRPL
jgi:hypothetical protein